MPEKEKKELYQRIEAISRYLCGGVPEFAKALGINTRTFYGYLSKDREHKLWPLLPEILADYPRVSRMWLYFGIGPMMIGNRVPLDLPVPQQMIAAAAEEIAVECGGTWQDILEYILACRNDERQDSSQAVPSTALEGALSSANERIMELQSQLIEAQASIIKLQNELRATPVNAHEQEESEGCAGRSAHTGQPVARLSDGNNN